MFFCFSLRLNRTHVLFKVGLLFDQTSNLKISPGALGHCDEHFLTLNSSLINQKTNQLPILKIIDGCSPNPGPVSVCD